MSAVTIPVQKPVSALYRLVAPQAFRRLTSTPTVGQNCVSRFTPANQARVPLTLGASGSRNYSQSVHEHFTNPRNVGSLDKADPSVGTAIVGKAACGDVIKLQVQIEDDIIKDVKFKAFGCGSAIASSSFASELIRGMTTKDALSIKNSEIAQSLSLPPVKIHCSLLAEDAIKMAIKDYQAKHATATASAA